MKAVSQALVWTKQPDWEKEGLSPPSRKIRNTCHTFTFHVFQLSVMWRCFYLCWSSDRKSIASAPLAISAGEWLDVECFLAWICFWLWLEHSVILHGAYHHGSLFVWGKWGSSGARKLPGNFWTCVYDLPSQSMCVFVRVTVCVNGAGKECWCLINFILRNFPGIPVFWWSLQYDHLMSVLPVSGWLLGKNKAADQEKGDSCLIHSMDLNPVGVQRFLIEGLVGVECSVWLFTRAPCTFYWSDTDHYF